jgi:threonine dehydrogenase-like Zn-dependent dehydrogenase
MEGLHSGRIQTSGIISPIVPFDDAAEAYRSIDEHPEQSIELGIRFPALAEQLTDPLPHDRS